MARLDPNRTIITFDGTKAIRANCKYIRSKFYEINRQCFKINSKWNRINNGKITFDYEVENWVTIDTPGLMKGIVSVEKNGSFQYGDFSKNLCRNVRGKVISSLPTGKSSHIETFLDEELLSTNSKYVVGKYKNLEYSFLVPTKEHNNAAEARKFLSQLVQPTTKIRITETYRDIPVGYGSAENIPVFTKTSNKYFVPDYIPKTNEVKSLFGKLPYTFGFEFETKEGVIPQHNLFKNGLIPCKDGSISGFEYVTVPMGGDKGINMLYKQISLLQKYCSISENEVLHVHLGGYPLKEDSIMALWYLNRMLEEDIYKLFPKHYKNTGSFKKNSYCGPLEHFDIFPETSGTPKEQLSSLYYNLSGRNSKFKGFLVEHHPRDNSGRHKWYVNERYKWVNFIPLMFGTRGTIEYRIHTPTMNFDKVINWLIIVQSILMFAEDNKKQLLTGDKYYNLRHVLNNSLSNFPKVVKKLTNYISYREKIYAGGKDVYGKKEINTESFRLPKELNIFE